MTAWSSIGLSSLLWAAANVVVTARLLPVEEYGLLTWMVGMSSSAAALVTLSIPQLFVTIGVVEGSAALRRTVGLVLTVALLLTLAVGPALFLLVDERLGVPTALLAAFGWTLMSQFVVAGTLEGLAAHLASPALLAWSALVCRSLPASAAIVAHLASGGALATMMATRMAFDLALAAATLVILRRHAEFSGFGDTARRLRRIASIATAEQIGATVSFLVERTLVGSRLGLAAVASYSVFLTTAGQATSPLTIGAGMTVRDELKARYAPGGADGRGSRRLRAAATRGALVPVAAVPALWLVFPLIYPSYADGPYQIGIACAVVCTVSALLVSWTAFAIAAMRGFTRALLAIALASSLAPSVSAVAATALGLSLEGLLIVRALVAAGVCCVALAHAARLDSEREQSAAA